MKKSRIFYIDCKKTVITVSIFTLISFILMLSLMLSVNRYAIQLNAYLHSNYDYSVMMRDTVYKDDYYKFNAGIVFMLSVDANTSLNADVVMQSKDSLYTDMIVWNTDILSTNGVAVSENIAKSNGLNLGDLIYSKHIVCDEKRAYYIEKIIPEATRIRKINDVKDSDGIIIMGYDELYIDNIMHNSIVFTRDSINDLSELGSFENIIYRDDEIIESIKRITPYLILILFFSVVVTVIFVNVLIGFIAGNFRRMIMLGIERKKLNADYYRIVGIVGMVWIIASFILSGIAFIFINPSVLKIIIIAMIPFTECTACFISSKIINKRLWRK